MSRFSIAKEKVLDDLEALIGDLFGAGASQRHKRGGAWNIASPWRARSKPSQMIIWLTGARRGGWADYVSGDKGDAIDLVAFAKEGLITDDSRMRAVAWIEDRYNIRSMSPAARKQVAKEAQTRRAAMAVREAQRIQSARERARKFFYGCQAEILGTPVDAYLQSRGIDLRAVRHLAPALRFRPDCEYWLDTPRDDAGRRAGPAPRHPAMIAAMVDARGRLCACHYTFLQPDGRGKADVDKPKLMFPDTSGLVIRLTYGPTGLNMEKAADANLVGPAGVTEGIEDALSAGISDSELRMMAAGSLPGFLTVPDHDAVNGWLVFQDNDWDKPQALKQFNRAFSRFSGFGKPAEKIRMPASWGKDVNDALNQGERA